MQGVMVLKLEDIDLLLDVLHDSRLGLEGEFARLNEADLASMSLEAYDQHLVDHAMAEAKLVKIDNMSALLHNKRELITRLSSITA